MIIKNRKTVKVLAILALSLLILFILAQTSNTPNTSALDYSSNTNVQFTFNPTLSISVSDNLIIDNLTPGTYSDSNIVDINVSTNSVAGYSLSASVGTNSTNNRLTHSSDSNSYFSSLSSNVSDLSSFSDNTWGYSYSTDSGSTWVSGNVGSTAAGYNGLPQDTNVNANDRGKDGVTLINTTNPADSRTIKFKIGARSGSNQPAGTYTNTINFYAVTNPEPPTMQTATIADCGQTLVDSRDGKDYTTALINGQCWMTQNLRTTGIVYADGSNFTTGSFNISEYSLDSNDSSYANHCDATNGYNYACSKDSNNDTTGVWYNYYAATAGTIATSNNTDPATQDICPSGWHLPSGPSTVEGTDFNKLVGNATSGWQDATSGLIAFNAAQGGVYYNGTLEVVKYGYWWSSTSYSPTSRYRLAYNSDSNHFYGDYTTYPSRGVFIRCVTNDN